MAINEQYWRDIISRQRRGVVAALLRAILRFVSLFYLLVTVLRRKLYSREILSSMHPNRPVVSIGNITTGGTGKTPAVSMLLDMFSELEAKPAVVSRGYRSVGGVSDEVEMLRSRGAKVFISSDRSSAAVVAISQGFDAIIMDDGFQHLKLQRDMNIAILDATNPFGYGHVLPAGLLREPASVLEFADIVILSRCDLVSEDKIKEIRQRVSTLTEAIVIESAMRAVSVKSGDGESEDIETALKGKKIFAFCGIGNPQAFFGSLTALGAETAGSEIFNDHHNYTAEDMASIWQKCGDCGADFAITTAKDAVKTARLSGGEDLRVLEIAMDISNVDRQIIIDKLNTIIEKYK